MARGIFRASKDAVTTDHMKDIMNDDIIIAVIVNITVLLSLPLT